MLLKQGQKPILITNIIAIIIFSIIFLTQQNYEFIIYVGVIILFLLLILGTNKRVNYPASVLWGLTLWAIMHMAGGGLYPEGKRLYEWIIIPLTQNIFRYDQLVHIIGFGTATLVMYYLIQPLLKPTNKKTAISIVIIMAGLGVGALNEIIEFLVTVIVPQTGVGGYTNTSLDLVADLIGAVLAAIYLFLKK